MNRMFSLFIMMLKVMKLVEDLFILLMLPHVFYVASPFIKKKKLNKLTVKNVLLLCYVRVVNEQFMGFDGLISLLFQVSIIQKEHS